MAGTATEIIDGGAITVDMGELLREVRFTCRIKGQKVAFVRLKLMAAIMLFAAWVGGVAGIDLVDEADPA